MRTVRTALCAGAILTFTAGGFALFADPRRPAALRASDLPGTYELVDRVLDSGKVLKRPDIAALYSFAKGRANLNLFVRNADGTFASESSIIRYTLSEQQYCEWIEYTTRNYLDAPDVTNQVPAVSSHCTPIKKAGDKLVLRRRASPLLRPGIETASAR
jgi:hypothetical protein